MQTLAFALQADSGLSIGELLRGIPHDFGALFAYFMIGTFAFLIWYGNKESQKEPPPIQKEVSKVDDPAAREKAAPPRKPGETSAAD